MSNPRTSSAVSPAAERMRRHRRRRLKGLRCVTIEIWSKEVDALVERGMLDPGTRDDTNAIRKALYRFFATALARRM
jgi:hypothetical protein